MGHTMFRIATPTARNDKLRCKKEYRSRESGRTFGALRYGVGAMRLEETLITKPHTSRCEASTSKRSDLIPLSQQTSAYSRQHWKFACSSRLSSV